MKLIGYFGAFLLLVATALLLVTTITSPVIDEMGILKIDLSDNFEGSAISFGTFGFCVVDARGHDRHDCSNSVVGYNPADVIHRRDGTDFSDYAEDVTRTLTKVMILHPIAAGVAFVGMVLGFGSATIGSLLASLFAALAFIVTLIALVCDFVLFAILRSNVNDNDLNDNHAYYAEGLWVLLVSCICSFLATIVLFVACCVGKAKKHHEKKKLEGHTAPRTPWYRRFMRRRT